MANSLNRNIKPNQKVIVKFSLYGGTKNQRTFRCESGFGMSQNTFGTSIFGKWISDNQNGTINGYDIDRQETDAL